MRKNIGKSKANKKLCASTIDPKIFISFYLVKNGAESISISGYELLKINTEGPLPGAKPVGIYETHAEPLILRDFVTAPE